MRTVAIALAVLLGAGAALADDQPSGSPVVIVIGDVASTVTELEPVVISAPATPIPPELLTPEARVPIRLPSLPPRRDQDGYLVDPATGLIVPRFVDSQPSLGRPRRARAANNSNVHLDPLTGLMIPDFDHPPPAQSTAYQSRVPASGEPHAPGARHSDRDADIVVDPRTGLLIPRWPPGPHSTDREP